MRLNKKFFIIIILILLVLIPGGIFGIKFARKAYHYIKRPKLFDARPLIDSLKGPSIDDTIKVFAASSLDRIFIDGKTLLQPSLTTEVSLSAAKNEYESFQIVIDTKSKDLEGVYIQISDLKDAQSGAIISHDSVTWKQVGYVPTQEPYYPVKFIGLWPDPLLKVRSVDVKAHHLQPFWITVYIPTTTPAGDYTGTVQVKGLDFNARTIPVSIHVYNFTLPTASHLKTAFDFYGHITKVRYPQGEHESSEAWHARLDDLNDQFIKEMLKYRMNPILNIDPTSETELARVDRYRALGLNNFAIGKHGGTFDNNWPKDDPSIEELLMTYRGYGETLKLNRMLDLTYIYTWDEGSMTNPLVPKLTRMIHQAYPGLKNMVCYHGIWDPTKDPTWGKDIDIWTFQIDDFDELKMKKLQSMGIEMWMYVSGPSGTTSPNLAMDFDSIDYRILPWICWKYDIKGFLYWCVNWWPTVDPFKDARNSKWEQNGNGLLFYPGESGPLPSLRVEIFRDGMEDYEYIQLLINNLRIIKQAGLEAKYKDYIAQSVVLLTMDNSLVTTPFNYTRKGEELINRRNLIAKKIEDFNALGLTP